MLRLVVWSFFCVLYGVRVSLCVDCCLLLVVMMIFVVCCLWAVRCLWFVVVYCALFVGCLLVYFCVVVRGLFVCVIICCGWLSLVVRYFGCC